jgi:hypothetical protein
VLLRVSGVAAELDLVAGLSELATAVPRAGFLGRA